MSSSNGNKNGQVSAWRLSLAVGVVWGLCMLLMGIAGAYTETYAHRMIEVMGSIYYGYCPGWAGAFIGLAWGFADAFIGTLIILALYRLLTCCRARTPEIV